MSLIGRILWARWPIVVISLICSLLGGLLAVTISPARYDAKARVTLNFLKADPITGVYMDFRRAGGYVQSQVRMVQDIEVVGPAVEASGWLDDPDLIATYQARDPRDTRDMTIWAAERIIPGIRASMVQDSNILQITFRTLSPETARAVVSAVRDAYIDVNVRERRGAALRQAQGFQGQADQTREEVIKLQAKKGAYEAQTGVFLREDNVDLDTLQMQALAPPIQAPEFRSYASGPSKAEAGLARLDAQIADAAAVLGANHPQLAALKANRAGTAAAVALQLQRSEFGDDMAAALEANRAERFASQKSKVLDQREELLQLRLLQDQINEKRAMFASATAAAARMREMSTMVESGVSLFGEAEVLPRRAFPNEPLIYGGATVIGLIGGVALAILTELFNLRIRTASALRAAVPAPLLGDVPTVRPPRPKRQRRAKARRAPKPGLQPVGAQ